MTAVVDSAFISLCCYSASLEMSDSFCKVCVTFSYVVVAESLNLPYIFCIFMYNFVIQFIKVSR